MGEDCLSKVRVGMLEDFDINSCYDVVITADTFVLNRIASVIDASHLGHQSITYVNITTYNMPCNDIFHVSLYQEGSDLTSCGPVPTYRVHCSVLTQTDLHSGYTQCHYECDCANNDCWDEDVIYLKVRHPQQGGLCDVTVAPP